MLAAATAATLAQQAAPPQTQKLLLGKDLYKRDGAYVPLNISSRSVDEAKINQTASSIAGTWFPPRTEFFGFMGQAGKWPLTEKGRAAVKSVDPKATTQKDGVPLGAPALMFYPVASTIEVQKDRVLLKVDWMDTERVYLDGRGHPPAAQTFLHGHSVGRWKARRSSSRRRTSATTRWARQPHCRQAARRS